MAGENEFEGRTEEEAVKRASDTLGVATKDLDYTVIDEGSGGILGFGARSARIRVRPPAKAAASVPVAAAPVAAPVAAPAPAAAPSPAPSSERAPRGEDEDEAPGGIVGPAPEKAARAREVAAALAEKMAMRADVQVRDEERDIVVVLAELEGSTDVADMLGGSRPPGVPSFQFLLNKIVNRFPDGRKHIVVEAPSVEAKVAERRAQPRPPPQPRVQAEPRAPSPPPPLPEDVDPMLATAARELAEKARVLGRVITIHPMSASDRRAVHVTITGLDGVQTVSEGEGLYRKIHIVPSMMSDGPGAGGKRRRRRRRRRRGGAEGGPGAESEGVEGEGGDDFEPGDADGGEPEVAASDVGA